MIQIIPDQQRHIVDFGWLLTRWHFSFSEYYDPANLNWGALRVFNDDIVQPAQGFPTHPHQDMEIVTYVLAGQLEHRDTTGGHGVLSQGELQVMSAGRGIQHSEFNPSRTDPVHFLQLWILPRQTGSKPRWDQRPFAPESRQDRLYPVVSDGRLPDTLTIDQDATIYLSKLSPGHEIKHPLAPNRYAYLFPITGKILLNGKLLAAGDQARIHQENQLMIQAEKSSDFILLDLPQK